MVLLRSGRWPMLSRALPLGSTLVAALLAAGCGSSSASRHVASWHMMAPEPPPQAAVKPLRDLEDDGLPAQTPPPLGVRDLPDDPTKPWSPNYGVPPGERALRAARSLAEEHTGEEVLPWQSEDKVASQDAE